MKKLLQIGEFSKLTGLSTKALRIYDEKEILKPCFISDTGYRYYNNDQYLVAQQIIKFKALGFSLENIKTLLGLYKENSSFQIKLLMQERLSLIKNIQIELADQEDTLVDIIDSIEKESELSDIGRRYIMSKLKQVSILVTGSSWLEETANNIIKMTSFEMITDIGSNHTFKQKSVSVISEEKLQKINFKNNPDIIIVNNINLFSDELRLSYLKLYRNIGPHMATVFNADDSESIKMAQESIVRKGRIFYFSQRKELTPQIKKIGGVVCDQDTVNIYGLNLKKSEINFVTNKKSIYPYISSLSGLLDVGLDNDFYL